MEPQPEIKDVHQLITDTVPMFFFVFDCKSGRVEFTSAQFLDGNARKEEFRKLDPHQRLEGIIHPSDLPKFHRFLQDLSNENHFKASVELRTKKEFFGIEWIEINTFKATKTTRISQKVVGHILDTSLKKKQYEILNRENERLENFINMMAHDLKAPLANLSLVAELLKETMTKVELEKYGKYLEVIKETTMDSGELIRKLLHFATLKGEASKLDLDLHDLRKIPKSVIKKLKERLEEKNLSIGFEWPDFAVEALVDITLFRQVIFNLLLNAIKFTPKGGTITFSAGYEKDKTAYLSIKDSGIGIPEKHLTDLFKNVASIKRDGLDGEKSTGLGLYICMQIMKIHNGKIEVNSKEEQGTVFTLLLPFPNASSTYF